MMLKLQWQGFEYQNDHRVDLPLFAKYENQSCNMIPVMIINP